MRRTAITAWVVAWPLLALCGGFGIAYFAFFWLGPVALGRVMVIAVALAAAGALVLRVTRTS